MKTDDRFLKEREDNILDAAADLMVRYGYDKTTMRDVAEAAGVTRAIVYQHFAGRDALFEAILRRETQNYYRALVENIEHDPDGGSLAGAFRSALCAARSSPFLSALMIRDRRVFGRYISKPGNLFASVQAGDVWVGLLRALQAAGVVRQDIHPEVFAHILNALSLGLMTLETQDAPGDLPVFDDIVETTALMLDRMLTPADGGNREAGKAILSDLAKATQARLEQGI
jgi:AcrR family transcriptional regulator